MMHELKRRWCCCRAGDIRRPGPGLPIGGLHPSPWTDDHMSGPRSISKARSTRVLGQRVSRWPHASRSRWSRSIQVTEDWSPSGATSSRLLPIALLRHWALWPSQSGHRQQQPTSASQRRSQGMQTFSCLSSISMMRGGSSPGISNRKCRTRSAPAMTTNYTRR